MADRKIETREEVSLLVRTFYAKVRKDELLGPIFNGIITDWETHLELLTDFWETNLFFNRKYFGNPMHAHVEVDKKVNNTISEMHFGTWINLWVQTIDDLFDPNDERAQIAIGRRCPRLQLPIHQQHISHRSQLSGSEASSLFV